VQEHCPPEKPFATRHSLLAAVLTFASRYSLPFPDLPICRFHDLPIRFGSAGASPSHFLVSRPAPRFKSVATKTKPAKAGWEKLEGASPDAPKIFGSAGALPSRKTRYSPFATRPSKNFRLQAKARIM
jgi:hypothetical protein